MAELLKNAGILLETAEALGVRVVASEQYPKGLGKTVTSLASKLGAMWSPTRWLREPRTVAGSASRSASAPAPS